MRNIVLGYSASPAPSPQSQGTPAKWATSASPEAVDEFAARARHGGPTWSPPARRRCGRRRPWRRRRPRRGRAAATPAADSSWSAGALVGGDVVGAHADAALQAVLRLIQPAERVDALQQLVGDAAHQRLHLPAAAAVEAGEIGHAAGRCPCRRGSRSVRPAACAHRGAPRPRPRRCRPARRRPRRRRIRRRPRCGAPARRARPPPQFTRP